MTDKKLNIHDVLFALSRVYRAKLRTSYAQLELIRLIQGLADCTEGEAGRILKLARFNGLIEERVLDERGVFEWVFTKELIEHFEKKKATVKTE